MTPPLPAAASITAAMTGTDAGVIRAIHARRPAAAHRLVPLVPLAPLAPWDLRDQWDPEDAPEHRALPDQLVPWGLRAM